MSIAFAFREKLAAALTGQGNFGAGMQTAVTRLAIFLMTIGTGVITARTMGANGRGLLAALLTWPQFIAYLSTFGLTASLIYNARILPEQKGRLLAAAVVLGLLAGAFACLAGVVFMPWMLPSYGTSELSAARLMMTTAPIILLALIVQTAAETVGDFPGANALRGISVAGTFLGVVILAWTGSLAPTNAALCYLLPQAPVGIWLFWRLKPGYEPTLQGLSRSARRLLGYGLRCYPVDLLNTALTYAGQAMVIGLLSPVEVGYFSVSVGVGRLLEVLYTTVVTILLPATVGRHRSEVIDQTLRAARLTLLLMIAVVIPLVFMLPVLMPLVYGANFADATPIARLLLVESAVSGTVWLMMQAFFALGRPEPPIVLQVIALTLLVSLLVTSVPRYGVLAAAAVLVTLAVVKLMIAVVLYRVVLKTSPAHILPNIGDLRFIQSKLRSLPQGNLSI